MESKTTNPDSSTQNAAAEIVSAALKREGVDPKKMGDMGYTFLVKGRPHLKYGWHALVGNPIALLIAFFQMSIVYCVVYDIYGLSLGSTELLILGPSYAYVHAHYPSLHGLKAGFIAAVPMYFLLNIGWGLMANAMCHPYPRPAVLLTGLAGFIPLRLIAYRFSPKWWFYDGGIDSRAEISILARAMQFTMAYRLAAWRNREESELDWAKALDRHLKVILDAYSSYVMLPAIAFVVWMVGVYLIGEYFGIRFDVLGIMANDDSNDAIALHIGQILFSQHFSIFALIGAWLTFERACLGAMTFRFLNEARTEQPTSSKPSRRVIGVALVVAFAIGLIVFAGRSAYLATQDVPPPPTSVLSRSPSYYAADHEPFGVYGLIAPASQNGYFYVVLEDEQKNEVATVFVRAGESIYFPVPAGNYDAKVFHGPTWHGDRYRFGFNSNLIGNDVVALCPHYRITHLNYNASPSAVSYKCVEYINLLPRSSMEDFDAKMISTDLLCASRTGDIGYPYIAGQHPSRDLCNAPLHAEALAPVGHILDAMQFPTSEVVIGPCCRG